MRKSASFMAFSSCRCLDRTTSNSTYSHYPPCHTADDCIWRLATHSHACCAGNCAHRSADARSYDGGLAVRKNDLSRTTAQQCNRRHVYVCWRIHAGCAVELPPIQLCPVLRPFQAAAACLSDYSCLVSASWIPACHAR